MTDTEHASLTSQHLTSERLLGQQIHVFSNIISGHFFRRTEQPFGVSLAEWRVLRSVLRHPGTSQGEIAAEQGLNVMNVSRAVAGLRTKGLVETSLDPQDRRRTQLSATAAGRDIGADIGARERLVYDHVFSVLSGDEVSHLNDLLERVNSVLREEGLPEPPPSSQNWAALLEAKKAEPPQG